MRPEDRTDYIDRYRKRLQVHDYSPQTLGWGAHGRQEIRYMALAGQALRDPASSVLDVGCGFADLYDFLTTQGWRGHYTGIDIVPDLLAVARERHPNLSLHELDIAADGAALQAHDFVVASGVFNARLKSDSNQDHIVESLGAMHRLARIAVSVDFLSTFVDYEKEGAWHTDPAWALSRAKSLSRRILLRLDYMPFEFALIIYRDDSVSARNVFNAMETFPRQDQDV